MNHQKISIPLFFLVLILLVTIPSTKLAHAGSPVFFNQLTGFCQTLTNGVPCVTNSFSVAGNSELILLVPITGHTCVTGAFGVYWSVSDTLGNSFTSEICSFVSNAGPTNGAVFAIGATTSSASGGSDAFTFTTTDGTVEKISYDIIDYTSFTAFGSTNTFSSSTFPGSNTLTVTTQPGSVILGISINQNENGLGCQGVQTISATTGQSVLLTNNPPFSASNPCLTNNGSTGAVFMDTSNNNLNGGLYSDGLSWACGTCVSPGFASLLIEVQGFATGNSLGTITQCYGNCGSPPITLANTNSTHSFNFNTSLTMFYEFQSNLNGFVLNETVSVARTYSNGEQVNLGIYTASCNSGFQPFTSNCPGTLRASVSSSPNIVKGRFTLTPAPVSVFNGQWVAIAVSAPFSGLDLNDTNTVVSIFNQQPGQIPASLSNGASFTSCSCKTGMWAFVLGNTVTLPPPLSQAQPNCGTDLLCTMGLAINGLTPTNPPVGAFILGIIWSVITIASLEYFFYYVTKDNEGRGQLAVMPPGLYILIFVAWTTMMMLIVGAFWYIFLEALIIILLFSGYVGSLVSGKGRGRTTE